MLYLLNLLYEKLNTIVWVQRNFHVVKLESRQWNATGLGTSHWNLRFRLLLLPWFIFSSGLGLIIFVAFGRCCCVCFIILKYLFNFLNPLLIFFLFIFLFFYFAFLLFGFSGLFHAFSFVFFGPCGGIWLSFLAILLIFVSISFNLLGISSIIFNRLLLLPFLDQFLRFSDDCSKEDILVV